MVNTVNAFLPLLKAGSAKKIIVLSTEMGDTTFVLKTKATFASAYAISKAAVNMAIAKYAVELEEEGFIVVGISPGMVSSGGGK